MPTITATINSDGTWNFNPAFTQMAQGSGTITLNLAGSGGASVSFVSSNPLTWFDPANPATPIAQPSDFAVGTPSGASVTITDDNQDSSTTMYGFRINALYNGLLLQSPDPTIINTGTGGFVVQAPAPRRRVPSYAAPELAQV
jgi:hypothetical protein